MQGRSRRDAPMLAFAGRRMTYGEMDRRSNRLAHALRALGVTPQSRVGYLGKDPFSYFEMIFAVAKLNAVPVPLNWRLSPREMCEILNDATAVALFVEPAFAASLEASASEISTVRHVIEIDAALDGYGEYTDLVHSRSCDDPLTPAGGEEIGLQLYTSGTTGLPKGVMHTNAALTALFRVFSEMLDLSSRSVILSLIPLFHIGGTAWTLTGMANGCLTVRHRDFDPAAVVKEVSESAVTTIICVPSMIQRVLAEPSTSSADFTTLRTLHYGGSTISSSDLREALSVFGCDFVQGFGMTECGIATVLPPSAHNPAASPSLLGSCGRPAPNTEIRVVDSATGRDVEGDAVGELWVRSPFVMQGYWNQPQATAEAITPDGWLRTGDAARRDRDGWVYIADRLKDMIITGGENVYSIEVENVLMEHAALAECAVIGIPSGKWGETVHAVVALRPDAHAEASELVEFCRERLAHYKCPTSITFVRALPRTPSGKVLKYQLRSDCEHL